MEDTAVKIVQLPVNEWQAYKTLRLEALKNDPQAFASSYQEIALKADSFWQSRLSEANQGRGNWLLFARENQSLLGMIGAFIDEAQKDTAIIISVYVARQARRRGIGKKLMAAILQAIKNDGIKTARLEVSTEQIAAIQLYKNSGFKAVKTTQRLMGTGIYHDELLLEMIL